MRISLESRAQESIERTTRNLIISGNIISGERIIAANSTLLVATFISGR